MYQNPAQTAQWSPNGPPPPQPQPQGQWSPQPPNGQYAPRPNQIPPISQAVPQGPAMQTLQPQHPDQYRALPPPQQMYPPPYQQQMPYAPNQPAPRQRTAIACRYCRRRKIRCSGFESSEDGRCTNCQRFSQECVFTPVSAQTQAFVPAHTVWRGQGPPPNTQLYGAYGQPLPQHGGRDGYPPQQQQQQQQQQQPPPGQYPPPPPGYPQQPMYQQPLQQPPPPNMQPLQATPAQAGQKRANDEPHTPTLPPPNPAEQAQGQRGPQQYGYPDPSGLTPAGASPASSNASFHSAQHPNAQPYYTAHPPARRASPQSAYSYDASRASSSPHMLGQPSTPAPPTSNAFQPAMLIREGRTSPQGMSAANAARQGVTINDIVGPDSQQQQQQQQAMAAAVAAQAAMKQEERTTTDTSNKEADGIIVTHSAEKPDSTKRRNGEVKDVGVQTDDLQAAAAAEAKEPAL